MMKRILLYKVSFFMVLYTHAQPVKLFYHYQNDTLLANKTPLQGKLVKVFTANDVLNKSNVYNIPYPIVTNNVFGASKVGSVPVNDFYPRLYTAPHEFQAIQSRKQTTSIGEHQQKVTTNYFSKTRII